MAVDADLKAKASAALGASGAAAVFAENHFDRRVAVTLAAGALDGNNA